ncbi:MAG: hypothetical protein JWQ27_2082 [Ferruginibacter sp.]|nr:hypothetical protein [Ferruginibacter sp.]
MLRSYKHKACRKGLGDFFTDRGMLLYARPISNHVGDGSLKRIKEECCY